MLLLISDWTNPKTPAPKRSVKTRQHRFGRYSISKEPTEHGDQTVRCKQELLGIYSCVSDLYICEGLA